LLDTFRGGFVRDCKEFIISNDTMREIRNEDFLSSIRELYGMKANNSARDERILSIGPEEVFKLYLKSIGVTDHQEEIWDSAKIINEIYEDRK
jgi:hypothetical protein